MKKMNFGMLLSLVVTTGLASLANASVCDTRIEAVGSAAKASEKLRIMSIVNRNNQKLSDQFAMAEQEYLLAVTLAKEECAKRIESTDVEMPH